MASQQLVKIDGAMRVAPRVPVQAMTTFSMKAPLATHWGPATCIDVDCPHHIHGWRTIIDETSNLGQAQAHFIRSESGRRFTERRDELGMTIFEFDAGQKCFTEHRQPLEREPIYLVRGGDARAVTTPPRIHANADDWIDDMQTNLDANRALRENG